MKLTSEENKIAHVEVAVHMELENHKRFSEWINSRNYGSRPFDRVWMIHDIAIQEIHKDKLLADLKWYHHNRMVGGWKPKALKKIINFLIKRFGMQVVDLDNVEKTPAKWFQPIKWARGTAHSCYLEVIGGFPDSFDEHGHEEI